MVPIPRVDALAAELEREDADPAARLRGAIAAGRELSAAGDALVERFVEEARAAGLSWTQIGELFGTSKQAAQKRYGGGPASAWPGPAGAALRPLLDRAADAARELGARCVGTEHVLLALPDAGGVAAPALADLGVTRAGVLAALGAGGMPGHDGALGVMPRLKRALELARALAARLGHDGAGPEHLLAAIVADRDSYAVCILGELGAKPRDVRVAIARRLGVDESELTARRRRRFRRAAA
jgi:hypothetical protein